MEFKTCFEAVSSLVIIALLWSSMSCSGIFNSGDSEGDKYLKPVDSELNKKIDEHKQKLKEAQNDYQRAEESAIIALLNVTKGNVYQAKQYADLAVKYQPNYYMAYFTLGKSYMEMGMYYNAQDAFEKSVSLNSKFAEGYFELGNALYKQFKYNEAKTYYAKAIQYKKDYFEAMNNLANMYVLTAEYRKAEETLLTLLKGKPDFAIGYKNLAILYDTKLHNKKKALEYYNKYLQTNPPIREQRLVNAWIQSVRD